jgi:uncharacterized protein (TIGR04168 family)
LAAFKIGVIGDLHTHWDEVDVAQFDASSYDLLYFVGDLGGGTPESTLRVARTMSRLHKPALVMPGNNDTVDVIELEAELGHQSGLAKLAGLKSAAPDTRPRAQLALCGYSLHRMIRNELDVTLVSARPHSMGGPELSFAEHMQRTYGVQTMQQSIDRLVALVDDVASESIVFLAHNGPIGMGTEPDDMWGCDFKPGAGDWGDRDLAIAIQHAQVRGKRILAVVAGHMHLRTKGGAMRNWCTRHEGTLYINAALVPRIFSGADDVYRHHVALTLTTDAAGAAAKAEEVLLPQSGA